MIFASEKKWVKKFTAGAVASLMVATTFVVPASATPASDYENNFQQRQELQQKIDANKTTIDNIQKEKSKLQTQYDDVTAQVKDLKEEIAKLDQQIAVLEDDIEISNQELDDKYDAYCNRVRNFEEYGTSNYWSIIFQSTSLTDLLGRIDFISEVMDYDQNTMDEIEKAIDELNQKETEVKSLKDERTEANNKLEELQKQLGVQIQERSAEIEKTEAQNKSYTDQYTELIRQGFSMISSISGQSYNGSNDAVEVYKKYIVDSGEQQRNPLGSKIVEYTLQFNGGPYVWGGSTPEQGFDCSGLMYYVYGKFGYNIMRVAEDQYHDSGTYVDINHLQAGDMIFFHPQNGSASEISHVGMYICDGVFIHAASRASGIKISSLNDGYYSSVYVGAKRIIG